MKTLIVFALVVCVAATYAADPEYVGSKRCGICHKKEESGAQLGKWESSPHAGAYETLLNDESKAIAKKQGLTTAPEESPECLRCHVTGWGSASGYQIEVDSADTRAVRTNDALMGVGCESCHGAGSLYKSKKTMVDIYFGRQDGAALGLHNPPEKEGCISCHNEDSPTYRPFDYDLRIKEIAHPYPEGYAPVDPDN